MSADNWMTCPACAKAAEDERAQRIEKAKKLYGKTTPEEFVVLMEKATKPVEELEETLREDYEFYVGSKDGLFHAVYRASCTVCAFEFAFQHEEAFVNQNQN